MEKILEKLKEIWGRVVEWWNNFSSKQKTMLIVIACGVVLAFAGLIALLSNPNYTALKNCSDTTEASQVIEILTENNIKYQVSDDGLRIKVPKDDLSSANIALGASGITSDQYTIETALTGGFTVTEADKQKKYVVYMEKKLAADLVETFDVIKTCKVQLTMAENDGTLLSKEEEDSVAVYVGLDGELDEKSATYLAKAIAGGLGMKNTDHVVIIDSEMNMLFTGSDEDSIVGNATSQIGAKADAEALMNNKVRNVLSGMGQLGDVRVSTNLDMDFSTTEETTHTYTPADGQQQGLLGTDKYYQSESSGSSGGVPGTDSYGETTYQYQNQDTSSSTIEEYYRTYLPNEYVKYTTIPAGTIKYLTSSVAVSSVNYIVIKEEDAKKQGLLDGISWEEYKNANAEKKQVTVPAEMTKLVADATGILEDNIQIVAYEENLFVDAESLDVDVTDVVQIILIVLILGLLALVVIRSMRSEKESEEPEQLSVETLLQSNPEPQLDNIELEETSETRRMIEKFVDENPEAVANLLRNWLNEDWG